MHRTTALVSIALLVALGACSNSNESTDPGAGGSGSSTSAPPGSSETPSVYTAPASPTQGAPATGTEPPVTFTASPDDTQTAALLAALNTVVPGVADDEERVLTGARDVCLDISQGKDDATLAGNAARRFPAPDGTAVTGEQASQLVQAVRDSFCHS